MLAQDWVDYSVIATGGGYKLERWGTVTLLRPDPQIIWPSKTDLAAYPKLDAHYVRDSSGGGKWNVLRQMPEQWQVSWRATRSNFACLQEQNCDAVQMYQPTPLAPRVNTLELKFWVKPMGFKHTGVFPEQAANWARCTELIIGARRALPEMVKVLNLFAYTGGATAACAAAGAKVTHVDAAANMVERAKANCALNKLPLDSVRYIVDDCLKFVKREQKRGKTYDAVIMDPPSYGRGPNGELWKLEDKLFELCGEVRKVLSDKPLFFLISSYTTGLAPTVLSNVLELTMDGVKGSVEADELCLPTEEKGIILPCGASGMWKSNE